MQIETTTTQRPEWAPAGSGIDQIENRSKLLKDDFLKLLVAQLQNQDPLSPASNQEFAAQLAQFSSLEQLQQINSTLQQNIDSNTQLVNYFNNSMATRFIGKEVRALGDRINLKEEGEPLIHFYQEKASAETVINIYNSADTLVRTLNLGSRPEGGLEVRWDGKDSQGNRLPAGSYRLEALATDYEGEEIQTMTFVIGLVSGVRYTGNTPRLLIGEQEVELEDVIELVEPQGSEDNSIE